MSRTSIVFADHHGYVPDGSGTESLSGAVAGAGVERNADDGDVYIFGRLHGRQTHERPYAAELRHFEGINRMVVVHSQHLPEVA